MSENSNPTGFWRYFGTVIRRAFTPFAWTRDLWVAAVIAAISLFVQARKGLIPDWKEHWQLWILSYAIPYVGLTILHSLYRFAEAPWRVHQELESKHSKEQGTVAGQLTASQNDNAALREHISKQTWPERRPQITFDTWGQRQVRGAATPEMGFYLTNHGDVALELIIQPFSIGGQRWTSNSLASIEAGQKSFVIVWPDGLSPEKGLSCWTAQSENSRETLQVTMRYRDFNNNWYRTTAPMTILGLRYAHLGASTQEKLGSS